MDPNKFDDRLSKMMYEDGDIAMRALIKDTERLKGDLRSGHHLYMELLHARDRDGAVVTNQRAYMTHLGEPKDTHWTLEFYKFPKGVLCSNQYFNEIFDADGNKVSSTPPDDVTLVKRITVRRKTVKADQQCKCQNENCENRDAIIACPRCHGPATYSQEKYHGIITWFMVNEGTGQQLNQKNEEDVGLNNNFADLGLSSADFEG